MKKSTLATLFAGLFSAALATTAIAKAGHDSHNHDDNHKMIKIKMEHQDDSPVTIELKINEGESQIFSFSQEEIEDLALVEARLADVDQDTREALLKALENLSSAQDGIVWQTGDADQEKQIFIFKHGDEADIDVDFISADGHRKLHKIIRENLPEGAQSRKMKFQFDQDGAIQLHGDPQHVVGLIKKLLDQADLTAEQREAIQQSLDHKR